MCGTAPRLHCASNDPKPCYSNYMYLNHGEGKSIKDKSRSGTAVQSTREINVGIFKPTKYISEILNKFMQRL